MYSLCFNCVIKKKNVENGVVMFKEGCQLDKVLIKC